MRANFSSSVTSMVSPGAISRVNIVVRAMGAVVAVAEVARAARTGTEKRMVTVLGRVLVMLGLSLVAGYTSKSRPV